jgi:hypothetical protein
MSSEMGEYWRDVKSVGRERRAANQDSSSRILSESGLSFETKNLGTHLIITHGERTVDFWPSTGLWIVRKGRTGRGVHGLISWLRNQP